MVEINALAASPGLTDTDLLEVDRGPGTASEKLTGLQLKTYAATPPGGVDTEIQYNNAGSFGGAPLTTDGTDVTVPTGAALKVADLNTGDEIITTDGTGTLQESGAKIESAPAGGSGLVVVEYASAPTSPPTGMVWIQAKDASTKTLNYYDGTSTFSVDLST